MKKQLNRSLLLVLLCVLATNFSFANNVLIKIEDPEVFFKHITLQRTYLGGIFDIPVNQTESLILARGTEIQLQVDSFFVGFLMNQNKYWVNQPIFITAGDTITFTPHQLKIDGEIFYKLVASGTNKDNYNFLADSQNNYGEHYQRKRDEKLALLEERKNSLSVPFYKYALAKYITNMLGRYIEMTLIMMLT